MYHTASRQELDSVRNSLNGFVTDNTLTQIQDTLLSFFSFTLLSVFCCVCVLWAARPHFSLSTHLTGLGYRTPRGHQALARILTLQLQTVADSAGFNWPVFMRQWGVCFLFSSFHFVPVGSYFSHTIKPFDQGC